MENLNKKPAKSILKSSSSFEQNEAHHHKSRFDFLII